jgi:hypothetical protein
MWYGAYHSGLCIVLLQSCLSAADCHVVLNRYGCIGQDGVGGRYFVFVILFPYFAFT